MPVVSNTTTLTPVARAVFNQRGERVSAQSQDDVRKIARYSDNYFFKWNKIGVINGNKGFGIGAAIAGFEMITAVLLWFAEKAPATFTNMLTTLSECFQVIISGYEMTKNNPERIEDPVKRKEAEERLKLWENRRRIGMAAIITGSGALGFYKWGKEYRWGLDILKILRGEKDHLHDVPLWQKITLSVSSFLNAVFMGIGYLEKGLMASISKKKNGGMKSEQMKLNGHSDGRCTLEWSFMTPYLFLTQLMPLRFLKFAIDIGIPLNALHDGISHLLEPWFEHDHNHENGHECKNNHDSHEKENGFKAFIRKILGHSHKTKISSMYYNTLFLGKRLGEGLRANLFEPLFRVFGCEPFNCHLNNDNNLVVSIPNEHIEIEPPVVTRCTSRSSQVRREQLVAVN